MTSHSPASSPELPPLPDPVAIADGSFNCNAPLGSLLHTTDQILAYATAHGLACYEAGSAAAAQAAWRPIAEAPKDGTSIMGYWLGGKHDCAIHATKFHNGRWWEPNEDYPQCPPTHWMPLPAAPTGEQA
jgi:hypothetical protein